METLLQDVERFQKQIFHNELIGVWDLNEVSPETKQEVVRLSIISHVIFLDSLHVLLQQSLHL
jgi:hypothetical protein